MFLEFCTTLRPTAKLRFLLRLLPTTYNLDLSLQTLERWGCDDVEHAQRWLQLFPNVDEMLRRFLCIIGCDVSSEICCRFSSGWTVSRSWVQPLVLAMIQYPEIHHPTSEYCVQQQVLPCPLFESLIVSLIGASLLSEWRNAHVSPNLQPSFVIREGVSNHKTASCTLLSCSCNTKVVFLHQTDWCHWRLFLFDAQFSIFAVTSW